MDRSKVKYVWICNILLCIFIVVSICYNINYWKQKEKPANSKLGIDYIESIKDRDVTFFLKEYIYSDQTRSGNCVFLITGLTQEDLQEVETNQHRMVGGYRFEFNSTSTGHVSLKLVDEGLEVNFQFSSGNDGLGEFDSDAVCVYLNEGDEVGRFDLKSNDKNGHSFSTGVAVSTTSVRIPYDVKCKDLQIICDGKKIDILKKGKKQMLSEYNSEYRVIFFDEPCIEKINQVKLNHEVINVDSEG